MSVVCSLSWKFLTFNRSKMKINNKLFVFLSHFISDRSLWVFSWICWNSSLIMAVFTRNWSVSRTAFEQLLSVWRSPQRKRTRRNLLKFFSIRWHTAIRLTSNRCTKVWSPFFCPRRPKLKNCPLLFSASFNLSWNTFTPVYSSQWSVFFNRFTPKFNIKRSNWFKFSCRSVSPTRTSVEFSLNSWSIVSKILRMARRARTKKIKIWSILFKAERCRSTFNKQLFANAFVFSLINTKSFFVYKSFIFFCAWWAMKSIRKVNDKPRWHCTSSSNGTPSSTNAVLDALGEQLFDAFHRDPDGFYASDDTDSSRCLSIEYRSHVLWKSHSVLTIKASHWTHRASALGISSPQTWGFDW